MSNQQPRKTPNHHQHGAPGVWSPSRPMVPSPFRPASPCSPSQSPHLYQLPRPFQPMSPIMSYSGSSHPMSPVPMGIPISNPGMSPVFGCPAPLYVQCPRPRWPSPISPGNSTARPYVPMQPQVIF